jgi:hypothetical protein
MNSLAPAETPDGAISETDMLIFTALSNKSVTDPTKIRKDLLEKLIAQKELETRRLGGIVEGEEEKAENHVFPVGGGQAGSFAPAVATGPIPSASRMALASTTPQTHNSPGAQAFAASVAQKQQQAQRTLSPSPLQQQQDAARTMSPTTGQGYPVKQRTPSLFEQSVMAQLAMQSQGAQQQQPSMIQNQLASPGVKPVNQWQTSAPSAGGSLVFAAAMAKAAGSPRPAAQSPNGAGAAAAPAPVPSSPGHYNQPGGYTLPGAAPTPSAAGAGASYFFGAPAAGGAYASPSQQSSSQQPPVGAQQPPQQQQPIPPNQYEIPPMHRYDEDSPKIRNQKQIALLEIEKKRLEGKNPTRVFTMDDPLSEIETEIDGMNSNENQVTMTSNMIEFGKVIPYFLVMLNQKVKISKINEEWADEFTHPDNMNKMKSPVEKIYKRFLKRAAMNPFLEIAFMFVASLVVWDLRCRFRGSGKERRKATVELEPEPEPEEEEQATAGGEDGEDASSQATREMPEPPKDEAAKIQPNGGLDMYMRMMGGGPTAGA